MTHRMAARVAELTAARVPFVHATVVRAQEPTSARPGDDAVVLEDGTIEGFVGGHCAEGSVRTSALAALGDGRTVLLRVLPEGEEGFPEAPSARVVVNPCLSGGALEIFLEPLLPAPLLLVLGNTPITDALLAMATPVGFVGEQVQPGQRPDGATAVVVASHGRGEAEALRSALDAGVPFIGLVASRRRGAAVLDEMALTGAERARVRTPVGLDIGARTAEEIALSIMADLVRAVRVDGVRAVPASPVAQPVQVIDPICGMTVVVDVDTPHALDADGDHWFCGTGCRDRYLEEHAELADHAHLGDHADHVGNGARVAHSEIGH
jgi:xanthine dehydrogenase accessory factor